MKSKSKKETSNQKPKPSANFTPEMAELHKAITSRPMSEAAESETAKMKLRTKEVQRKGRIYLEKNYPELLPPS